MIKRLICTIFGHTKPTEFLGIFQLYTKCKDTYFSEGKFHRCRRCHKLVYLGKGILTIEAVDIVKTTLQDLNFLKG